MWRASPAMDARPPPPQAPVDGHDDPFDLPPLDAFPRSEMRAEEPDPFAPFPAVEAHGFGGFGDAASVHSDEFTDAEAFMKTHRPGEDSFLREATGGDPAAVWNDSDDEFLAEEASHRRASDIFVPKSRNMEKVEFSSPEQVQRKVLSVHHQTPVKEKLHSSRLNGTSQTAFSTTNTAQSSEFEIHVDHRLALTPNSMKYLQNQQRDRLPSEDLKLSHSNISARSAAHDGHSRHAKQVVDAYAFAVAALPDLRVSTRPTSAEKAMRAGPAVIKKALHEIETMLQPLDLDGSESEPDSALDKLKSRRWEISTHIEGGDHATDTGNTQEDNLLSSLRIKGADSQLTRVQESGSVGVQAEGATMHEAGVQTNSGLQPTQSEGQRAAAREQDAAKTSWPEDDGFDQKHRMISLPSDVPSTSPPVIPRQPAKDFHEPPDTVEAKDSGMPDFSSVPRRGKPARPAEARMGTSFRTAALRQSLGAAHSTTKQTEQENTGRAVVSEHISKARSKDVGQHDSVKANASTSLPLAAAVPKQVARRCRRFLCSVGERMSEQIVFSNGSSAVGRICVSLLPLSTGCQQFSVAPAVLELQPRSRSSFLVTFEASQPGVVAGIFQFRAVGVNDLFDPYEVLIECSVRGDLQLAPPPPPPVTKPPRTPIKVIRSSAREARVTEFPLRTLAGVQITPTFIRFSPPTLTNGSTVRVANSTADSLKFQVKCSHEHLQVSPARGTLSAGLEVEIEVHTLCRPFGNAGATGDWCGSMTVVVGDVLSREVSVVIDRDALASLPAFDDVARVRQAISTQTDSFYYTKKVNRRGLYFHARAVECGSCIVGESHQVPVYICNGSDSPMTVFLQALQDPFGCVYQPTTLQARKFIEVPISFRPKAVGKVATCLVAYTVTGKAAVTLIARGVEKSPASALVTC